MRRLAAALALAALPQLGQAQAGPSPGLRIQDEGVTKGTAVQTLNCIGPGISCSVAGSRANLNVTGGGGGSSPAGSVGTLQTNADGTNLGAYSGTGSAPASQWLQAISAGGAGVWAQPDWSNLSGKPSTYPATTPVATASALATAGTACGAGLAARGVDASGNASGCFTPTGTYALPDAAAATKGGLQLAGDLGGTAASPSVPGLASRSGTGTCAANTWASTLNGAAAPTCTQPAFSNLSGAVAASQLPAPGASSLGGVRSLTCGGTDKLSAIGIDGLPVCSADQTGGGGGAPTTSKYLLQVADGSLPNAQTMGALGTGLVLNTTATGVQSIFGGSSCSAGQAPNTISAAGAFGGCLTVPSAPPTLPLSGTNGGLGQAQPTCSAGQALTCSGTTCSCTSTITASAVTGTLVGLTANVSGTLPIGNGGTNSTATATNGGVGYGTGTAHAYTAAGTEGQSLYSAGAAAPTWGNSDKLVMLASNYTNATTTISNTALTWSTPDAVSRSVFDCILQVKSSATTLGTQLDVTSSVAPTSITYQLQWVSAAGTAPATGGTSAFVATSANSTALGPTAGLTAYTIWKLSGVILHTSSSSTVTIRAKASGTGTVTIGQGSACQYGVF